MKKALDLDLSDVSTILESFVAKLDKQSEADLIDIAARLKPVAKHIEAIDKHVKALVKEKLHEKEGTRLGGMFKAVLKLVPTSRFQAAAFKEAKPAVYESYCEEKDEIRITFEVR